MDLLLVCHYGLYHDRATSFVHAQAAAFAQAGHRVRVVVPIAYGKTDEFGKRMFPRLTQVTDDGVELYVIRYASLSRYGEKRWNQKRAIGSALSCWDEITRDFSPCVVYAHTLGFDSQLGRALADRLGCRLVVTSHGSDASVPYEKGDRERLRNWCDEADCVVAVSSALANKLLDCNTKTPIKVILNGFRSQHLPPPQPKEEHTWVQVGHLTKQKRVDVTIRAFAKATRSIPHARLTIIGSGAQRQALEELCEQCDVVSKVTFTGQIPNARVLEILSRSQYFVMPSIREGFGIVYLEAMACGCITIGTQGEGIADVIRHKQNGFLVAADCPQDIVWAVESCQQDPALAQAVAQAGRQDALQQTWHKNAQEYLELFTQLPKAD